jgi:hypothetical protein
MKRGLPSRLHAPVLLGGTTKGGKHRQDLALLRPKRSIESSVTEVRSGGDKTVAPQV